MSMWNFPESLSQRILAGRILAVGRLGVIGGGDGALDALPPSSMSSTKHKSYQVDVTTCCPVLNGPSRVCFPQDTRFRCHDNSQIPAFSDVAYMLRYFVICV